MSVTTAEGAMTALVTLSERLAESVGPEDIALALADALQLHVAPSAFAVYLGGHDAAQLVECRGVDRDALAGLEPGLGFDLPVANVLPITARARRFGTLVVGWREPPPETTLRLAEALADLARVAFDRGARTRAPGTKTLATDGSPGELADVRTARRLSQMAGALAHEFKNPLASIAGVLQILHSRFADDAADRQVVEKVLVRLGELNLLVDELIQFARRPPAEKARVRLDLLLDEAAAAFRTEANGSDVTVEVVADAIEVDVDREMVHRAVRHLLLNAQQAMEGGGVIRVRVARDRGAAHVQIDDEGTGIPDAHRERVFEPFYTTRARGAGLGLAVARQVLEAHGGTIEVCDAPLRGARFVLSFPTL